MSQRLSDEQIDAVERTMGNPFVENFVKIWDERRSVINYRSAVVNMQRNTPRSTYWPYKLRELDGVIDNQTAEIRSLMAAAKEKLPEKLYTPSMALVEDVEKGIEEIRAAKGATG